MIVPLAVPHILTAMRVALGVAWATLVASELIAAQQGLGALIQNASSFFQLDIIYVGIICIGLIALAMDLRAARGDAPAGRVAGPDRVVERAAMQPDTLPMINAMSAAVRMRFDDVGVDFPTAAGPMRVVDDVSLDIRQGEFVSIIGPSGCGKTTMMNIVGGFVKPTRGACCSTARRSRARARTAA